MKIYNSASNTKENFLPHEPKKINMYVCGMTVYDFCHIGNARVFVFFDVVARYFKYLGYEVNYVRNITDIDDKIINKAREKNVSWKEIASFFAAQLEQDEHFLGILDPLQRPKATDYIEKMIAMIEMLIEKGFAYKAPNGDIYFDVSKVKSYGVLIKQDLDSLKKGARVEVDPNKKGPFDFALWKHKKENEPFWEAPFGAGRPGWHSECVVMSKTTLGENIDIHGGGIDLKFPHHENEIVQAVALSGKNPQDFVHYWMHVGFLNFHSQKMSKSLGNVFTVHDLLQKYDSEVLRLFLLSAHYRSSLEYSEELIEQSRQGLNRLYNAIRNIDVRNVPYVQSQFSKDFVAAMDDDFGIPKALSYLFELSHVLQKESDISQKQILAQELKTLANIFGLLEKDPETYFQEGMANFDVAEIENLIAKRNEARQNHDFAKADSIRDQLTKMGIELEDTKEKTLWHKK